MSEYIQNNPENEGDSLLSNRQIIAYFDHEFTPLHLPQVENDMTEIADMHFTNVVLCITEKDIASKSRMHFIKDTVEVIKGNGLEVWADPWSVGSVFGGEGGSAFKDSGQKSCMCNPNLDLLLQEWLNSVATTGVKTVFWDEPEMKCTDHRDDELKFLEKYTAAAGRLALDGVVCLCANECKKHQLKEVAHLPDVIEIATDPYFPNAFNKAITETNRRQYVDEWTRYTQQTAAQAGIKSHVWVQAFGVPTGQEVMIEEHIGIVRDQHLADIALWGYRGCASVPNFVQPNQAAPAVVWDTVKRALT